VPRCLFCVWSNVSMISGGDEDVSRCSFSILVDRINKKR
jgi:hypothetical protein